MVASEGSCLCRCRDEGGELKIIHIHVGGSGFEGHGISVGNFKYGFMGSGAFQDGCVITLVIRFIGICIV